MRIGEVKGVGPALIKKFSELGIYSVADLISVLPKSYVDMDAAFSLDNCSDGDFCAFCGILSELSRPHKQSRVTILHGRALCNEKEIKLVFYNQNYFAKTLEIGQKYLFFGKVKKERIPLFVNPKVDVIGGKIGWSSPGL